MSEDDIPIRYPGQATGENPFRCCLWCNKEIGIERRADANFCRFNEEGGKANCADKFKAGISQERYWDLTQRNLKKPIRGWISPTSPKERRDKQRSDNRYRRLCKLSEYPDKEGKALCTKVFPTQYEDQLYCTERHRIRANSIRARERRIKRNIELTAALKKQLGK